MAINSFSDLDLTELKFVQGNVKLKDVFVKQIPQLKVQKKVRGRNVNLGFKTGPVKDQGSCLGSWAYAATSLTQYDAFTNGNLNITLSEQDMIDCNPYRGSCEGANPLAGLAYAQTQGQSSMSTYPYRQRNGKCKRPNPKIPIRWQPKNICHSMMKGDDTTYQIILDSYGPILIMIAMTGKIASYSEGVYDDLEACGSTGEVNHAVVMVGYGSDAILGDYYLIKNSWGPLWGEDGYMRIRAGMNMCGIGFGVWVIFIKFSNSRSIYKKFSLLRNFTCAVVKDKLENHPEIQTIAMIELENNFSSQFSREIVKCLPDDVTKIVMNNLKGKFKVLLPKSSMIIFLMTKIQKLEIILKQFHHLSKFLIISCNKMETENIFKKYLNFAQIYEENEKVIVRNFYMTKKFESAQQKNLSQILFPEKAKNLYGYPLYVAYSQHYDVLKFNDKIYSKWTFFIELIAHKLNATLNLIEIPVNLSSGDELHESKKRGVKNLIDNSTLDFYLNSFVTEGDLESYNQVEMCFMVPLPSKYSIYELILILPLDKSCWMWLGISIAVSTLVWKFLDESKSHWEFLFGSFAIFVGKFVKVQTSRLTLKILLQILIFSLFVISNGYQVLVTSFMLKPIQEKLLKSIDELFESDLKIEWFEDFNFMYQDSPKFQNALSQNRIINLETSFEDDSEWTAEYVRNNFASMQSCKHFKNLIEHQGDGKSWRGLYQIQEVAFIERKNLFTSPFHPYIKKFQYLMDLSFEAGLPMAWEKIFYETSNKINPGVKSQKDYKKLILDFNDIGPFFLVPIFGFLIALLTLLCEIFYHDFLSHICVNVLIARLKNKISRKISKC